MGENFIFQDVELMLQDVELMLQDVELMLQDVEDKISSEGKTFFPRARNFFALFVCFSMRNTLILAEKPFFYVKKNSKQFIDTDPYYAGIVFMRTEI